MAMLSLYVTMTRNKNENVKKMKSNQIKSNNAK